MFLADWMFPVRKWPCQVQAKILILMNRDRFRNRETDNEGVAPRRATVLRKKPPTSETDEQSVDFRFPELLRRNGQLTRVINDIALATVSLHQSRVPEASGFVLDERKTDQDHERSMWFIFLAIPQLINHWNLVRVGSQSWEIFALHEAVTRAVHYGRSY